ncbi:MAG: porin [Gammaproteobacteria bacterium]|nr:MAG: porin [Gammaproteobacteria bacterium]
MTFNKKLLAGLVAFAAASTSAQAVTVAANDGWTLGVSGSVNQFLTFTDVDGGDNVSEVRNGLLPAFLSFDMTAPTMNGLDIAAHISISPSTNGQSYAGSLEQREAYFTVAGSFGQVLAGKAIGLYGSHNILTDQTLFGVGYGTTGNLQTTLGGINLGYDYANWRSQIKWTSNDMNGFKIAFAAVDPNTGTSLGGNSDQDNLRFEGDLSYAGAFDGGSYTGWLSAMHQSNEGTIEDNKAWTVGGTLVVGGFEAMAQYSDSEQGDFGTAASLNTTTGVITGPVAAVANAVSEYDQFIVQAGYRFAGTTLVSAQYSEREDDIAGGTNLEDEKWTIGVYHDVNANLKLVAEYTNVEMDNDDSETDIISLGGFVFF